MKNEREHLLPEEEPEEREDDLYPDVDRLVELGYMQDFGLGYPEWS